MKMKALLLGAAAAVVLSGTASAGYERDGWYVGLEAGWNRVSETDFQGSTSVEFEDGWAALGTVGYAFKNSKWRMEGEVGYRTNDVDAFGGKRGRGDASLEEWSGMINAIYDFNLNSEKWGLGLGAGIGIDNPRFKDEAGSDSNDKVFAFQGIAGLTYRVNQHWDLVLNYRYFNAAQAELDRSVNVQDREIDFEKHSVTIGFRYGYNEEPKANCTVPGKTSLLASDPGCVPDVPPACTTDYRVFFGFNKANLEAAVLPILDSAVKEAMREECSVTRVQIVGHTDTSGSNAYNQELGMRRAHNVFKYMQQKFSEANYTRLPGTAFNVVSNGETTPLKATGDGVKEPENRRVEISLGK